MQRSFGSLLAVPALLTLAACGGGGGGGGSGSPAAAQTATVGIALTDAPSLAVDQALATITSIQLLGPDGPVTIFAGVETVDLLKLGDFSELFAVSPDVPAGTYSKIRLQLSGLELVKLDANGNVIETITPKLVANGKLDLNPQGPFYVAPGATLVITVDFDVEKSLKIIQTGNGKVIVRPVVFVDIADGLPSPGLTRVHGIISDLSDSGNFRLCQTEFVASPRPGDDNGDHPGDHCVRVQANEDTGVFGLDGLPQSFLDLRNGDAATVVGQLRPHRNDDNDGEDDGGDDGDDDRVIEGRAHFGLDAFIIEQGPLGTFRRLAGLVASPVDVDTDRFELDLAPGQGIVTDAPLPVQLYQESRIFTRRGIELTRADLAIGTATLTDAVLALSGDSDSVLRSPLVVVKGDGLATEVVLSGSILTVNAGNGVLNIATEAGDRCVNGADASVFLIDDNGLSFDSERGTLGDLSPGQEVNVFGREGLDGCLVADTILAGN